jgi:hypothetical protein
MFGVLLATFPLREGYTATFPTDPPEYKNKEGAEPVEWLTFRVTGRESVAAGPGRQVEAWVVETDMSFGHDKFWLTREPPYVIKLIYTGPRGGKQVFEMM